ncbi:hypothetical protein OQZ33_19415 [Pedobacter sp. MC2016-05]|uniref:hypothetical protein n=1 Tax=Pedobacter sp. MC2016-05 TaxID=2994474 RepID=UPI0022484FB5|nr:hypothetical protein [Pedobacter sp. MC2016-05]MCX2476512.1 hypothetical protein [Pedobacter sp. MC2016-05]
MQLAISSITYHQFLPSSVRAFLLLILFVGALLVQNLHHHEQEVPQLGVHNKEETSVSFKYSTAKASCKLCDLIKNQSQDFDSPNLPVLAAKTGKYPGHIFGYLFGHTANYILSAANKGPPALVA